MRSLADSDGYGSDRFLAYFLLRLALGINIFMHGAVRLPNGAAAFVSTVLHNFATTPLPQPLMLGFAHVLPWIEAVLGILLITGLFTRWALVAGSVLMVVLTFGSSLQQDWGVVGIQLTYSLVYSALLACRGFDGYSLDAVWGRGKTQGRSKL